MTASGWNPDLEIIKLIEKTIKELPESWVISIGGKFFSHEGIIKEIKEGTELGRDLYNTFLEELEKQD